MSWATVGRVALFGAAYLAAAFALGAALGRWLARATPKAGTEDLRETSH